MLVKLFYYFLPSIHPLLDFLTTEGWRQTNATPIVCLIITVINNDVIILKWWEMTKWGSCADAKFETKTDYQPSVLRISSRWHSFQTKTKAENIPFRAECDIRENFDTNECPNIFVSTKLHEWISEYIHIIFLTRTNVRISIRIENCTNIRIYLNIRLGFTL